MPEGERAKLRRLAEAEEIASITHKGGYETIGETYGQLMGWLEANDYWIAGPDARFISMAPNRVKIRPPM
jgi:effector-binding domain-containing protein